MKKLVTLGLVLALLGSLRAFAQAPPNPAAEQDWQRFLSKHPGLAQNPQWLDNPTYLKEHPNMTKWLQQHPAVFRQARGQGMWDRQGNWHDSSWWHDHDADDVYRNHPEWAEYHRDWHGKNDGDADDHHHWHNRHWWMKHHPNWVREHHPGWADQGNPEPDHED